MVNIGNYNTLQVLRVVDFGVYLDGGEKGDILLPLRYVPQNYKIGDEIDVLFITTVRIASLPRPNALMRWWANLPYSKSIRSIP